MKTISVLFIMGLILYGCGGDGGNDGAGASARYYPLTVGSKWTYQDWSPIYGTSTSTNEVLPDGRVKGVSDNNAIWYSTVKSDNIGIYCSNTEHNFISALYNTTVTASYNPSYLILPNNLINGQTSTYETVQTVITDKVTTETSEHTYTQSEPLSMSYKITVVGSEIITVPAGTFDAIKIQFEESIPTNGLKSYHWYAYGIGMVKAIYVDNSLSELTSYSIR